MFFTVIVPKGSSIALNEKFYKRKRIVLFSKFNLTFVTPDYFWDTTSVSKEEESLKSFVAFLKKVCLILRFQTMKLQKKVLLSTWHLILSEFYYEYAKNQKKEAACPTKKMPLRSKERNTLWIFLINSFLILTKLN